MNAQDQPRECNRCGLTTGFVRGHWGGFKKRCERYEPTAVDRRCGGWMVPDPNVRDDGKARFMTERNGVEYVGD